MDEALWPARNVAEYAYCPRLFYYMEVEGIHVPSDDTVEGVRIHRRVDAPSLLPDDDEEADEDRPAVARSLTLTSPRLGLTATLDLAEIAGETAVPVEYRKGRPFHPRDDTGVNGSVEPWPTDRVQVGLQALLLEEAGYRVPNAVLYYAAERRRVNHARLAVRSRLVCPDFGRVRHCGHWYAWGDRSVGRRRWRTDRPDRQRQLGND